MNAPRSMTIRLGEAVLEMVRAGHPDLTIPRQEHVTADLSDPENAATKCGVLASQAVAHIIHEQASAEAYLSEGSDSPGPTLVNRVFFMPDRDGNIRCAKWALIGKDEKTGVMVNLDCPGVVTDILRGSKCSGRDLVRLATYLVCLTCQAVRAGSSNVGVLSEAVGLLSRALADFRVTACQDSNNQAPSSDEEREPVDG